jgi:hypothetical protein
MEERRLILAALMAVFGLQFGWVFLMQRSCVVSSANRGGAAAAQLCEIAADRFGTVSRSAQDVFLSLLVPVGAAALAAQRRKPKAPPSDPRMGGPQP